jgi:hypothetical protein
VTAADGTYAFPGLVPGSYTVTPELDGHAFAPESATVEVTSADVGGVDFAGAPIRYAIGGTVSGPVVAGVTVTLFGLSNGITTTAADGTYGFPGLRPGLYTVTPELEGYAFTPQSDLVLVTDADVGGVDFAGALVAYALSGTVSGASDVTITLTGPQGGSTVTSGAFSFASLVPGTYTVEPSKPGYIFTPPSVTIEITSADVAGVDFAGALITYSIRGTVSGDVAAGVTVGLGGEASATTTTGADGTYVFSGLTNGSYTVTPTLFGHDFSPASIAVTVSGADVAGRDFTSTEDPDRDDDGIPNGQDSFPDDPSHFASYETVLLARLAGGVFGTAVAVNGSAEVVGVSEDAGGDLKAVRWTVTGAGASAPDQLDPLGAGSYSAAYGIGEDGVVVGESAKGNEIVAVAWLAGSSTPVELSLAGFGTPAAAYGVSGSRIVGEADGVAVLWDDPGADPVALGTLGLASGAAYAISENGLVVGEGVLEGTGQTRGVVWALDASGLPGPPVVLPPIFGHVGGIALGVSAAGEIAGESESASGEIHAVLWRLDGGGVPDPPIDLGIGSASAINGASRVVGSSGTPNGASAWDVRNTSLADAILTEVFTVSQGYGANELNFAVGRADDRGFVAVPR